MSQYRAIRSRDKGRRQRPINWRMTVRDFRNILAKSRPTNQHTRRRSLRTRVASTENPIYAAIFRRLQSC